MAIDLDNYIIAHHLNKIYRIPMYPSEVADTLDSTFIQSPILARSAPLQSWSGAGPRIVSFGLTVHRDLDWDDLGKNKVGDIEALMKEYQALTLPNYSVPMLVVPPKITVRIGNGIRITGIPTIGYTNKGPLDEYGNYMSGEFSFEIKELEPYDALEVASSLYNARGGSRS